MAKAIFFGVFLCIGVLNTFIDYWDRTVGYSGNIKSVQVRISFAAGASTKSWTLRSVLCVWNRRLYRGTKAFLVTKIKIYCNGNQMYRMRGDE